MDVVVLYVAVVFGCGLLARLITMPPLVGFVAAGFVLNVMGVPQLEELSLMSQIGVTLMLFAIGLRLNLRTLLGKEVWLTAGAHILLMTVIGAGFLAGLGALGAFGPESLRVLAVVALVLSFSSTIFVVKILQDRGDEQAFYGNICIGVLIIQDIVAVAVISVSRGEAPSIYSLGLVAVIPALAWATKGWYRLGHGELGALFGIAMALIPGYALFEWLGLSGSLGALVMGLILAPRPGSDRLSHTLFTVKELLLVGFFVSIGFQGLPTMENVRVGLLLVLLLPVQAVFYWFLLWLLGLRNRTSVLTSLLLSNYSEFALIVATMGVSAGWLSSHWLLSLVIAVSVGFIVSSLANPASVSRASRLAERLPARPPDKIHPEDRPIDVGDATAIVLGMGRVGRAACTQLEREHGYRVLGVEHDPSRVQALREEGYNVIEGDATDYDFWTRVVRNGLVQVIVLAMPSQHANIDALREMRRVGYRQGTVAAVALYREDVEELEELGLDVVVHLYAGAGEALADRSARAQAGERAEGTGLL
ncbi:MAG: cation:proton antiporter [Intrasporangium sp.]|uniref:cation:proton antiporter family protein n=1 Tax=Intrasporangium sp. TaxID=1925024 RepID=UPI00264A17B6|nr:cation:proton antiporter family protein [Intrasporangium sp.]MDN5796006.1 cation:proton antiporter [Intrasporangium sp.]